jgi:hypothetical protein
MFWLDPVRVMEVSEEFGSAHVRAVVASDRALVRVNDRSERGSAGSERRLQNRAR